MSYATLQIVSKLQEYLADAVPSLKAIYSEWPSPGQVLNMPCISIISSDTRYIQGSPRNISQGEITYHKSDVLYYVGQYESTSTLHLWTSNKTDRAKYFELVKDAMDPYFSEGQNGLLLTLDGYYDQVASYLFDGYDYPIGEEAAQRNEWRVILNVTVFVNAVREYRQPVMENIDVTVDPTTQEF